MCLFSRQSNLSSFKRGSIYQAPAIDKFDCGVCPECLAKKARLWALRCSAESQYNRGIMVTLTYDDYKYCNGRIVGELPPKKLLCNVEHCQLFIKRLRKWIVDSKKRKKVLLYKVRPRIEKTASRIVKYLPPCERKQARARIIEKKLDKIREKNKRIDEYNKSISQKSNLLYLLSAEHGSRTNRAHYHAILFGIDFKDRVPYKKSKRGNLIYKSEKLTKLWSHGICTIDAVNITGQVARYCTKYCAKDSRCDDTFMLMSRGIGDKWLLENFNGKSYILDGVEYPIPKLIWNKYIQEKIDCGFNGKRTYIVDNVRYPIPQIAVKRENRKVSHISWLSEPFICFLSHRASLRKESYLRYLDDVSISYKYKSCKWLYEKYVTPIAEYLWGLSKYSRQMFSKIKNNNPLYKAYLQYWQKKAEIYELNKPSDLDRIKALKDDKYFFYKQKAIRAKLQEELYGRCIVPRSGKKSLVKFGCWKYICPDTLVNKGQMTPRKENNFVKTAYWSEKVRDFIYLRPVKVR